MTVEEKIKIVLVEFIISNEDFILYADCGDCNRYNAYSRSTITEAIKYEACFPWSGVVVSRAEEGKKRIVFPCKEHIKGYLLNKWEVYSKEYSALELLRVLSVERELDGKR